MRLNLLRLQPLRHVLAYLDHFSADATNLKQNPPEGACTQTRALLEIERRGSPERDISSLCVKGLWPGGWGKLFWASSSPPSSPLLVGACLPTHPLPTPPHAYNTRPGPVRSLVLLIKCACHTGVHIIFSQGSSRGQR